MLDILKKIFHNSDKETITIFEKKTKIDYDPKLFLSLKVLSLTNSRLKNLEPLLVFINLEILNISHNKIQDVNCLEVLKKLKIIDLRFNKIEKIPLWIFDQEENIYWERRDEEQEGIFLEGNPLDKDLIEKIKNYPHKNKIVTLPKEPKKIKKPKEIVVEKPITIEQLIPLNRQHLAIFTLKNSRSNFVDSFISSSNKKELKLNLSILEYNSNYKIINSENQKFQELKYIILLLKEAECCLNPPIVETLSNLYIKSKIFLIIENSNNHNMKDKITFFKTYSKSINIIEVYHTFNSRSNSSIEEKIYNFLKTTRESNTLWRKNWIALRDEIENSNLDTISREAFKSLAQKHKLTPEVQDEIFLYLKKVGSIKEYH